MNQNIFRLGTTQVAAYTSAAAACTNGFGSSTSIVRVCASTACYIKIGNSPTATTSDVYLPANHPEYFVVTPGMKVSAIRTTTNGNLNVVEVGG